MENTLLKDKEHGGRFVALKSFDDKTVIVDGKNPSEVFEKARQKGCQDPVILFVPVKDMVQIY